MCIGGSVVECSPATRAARVRFPADARCFRSFTFTISCKTQTSWYWHSFCYAISVQTLQSVKRSLELNPVSQFLGQRTTWIDLCQVSFRSVVVITLASHARGPGFETQRKHWFFMWTLDTGWIRSYPWALNQIDCPPRRWFIRKVCYRLAKFKPLIPLGFEPRTSRVLGERDNHYTMESALWYQALVVGMFLMKVCVLN